MHRIALRVVSILLTLPAALHADDSRPLEPRVVLSDKPARLVQLTAHLRVNNSSNSDISRFVFRVTAPPDLDSQRSVLLSSGVPLAARKKHKNGANEYLEFQFPVAANREVVHDASFLVLLMPVDYSRVRHLQGRDESKDDRLAPYLKPSRHIESDALEVKQAASLVFNETDNETAKARAAYEFPARILKFQIQKKPLGARQALQTRTGDCTEYACLFAALCRSQAIPARRVGVFNLGKNNRISVSQPNHHIAEVHLSSHGWIPVDANLGRGRHDGPIGFGKLGNTVVILNREGAWVWSTWLPPNGFDKSRPKPTVDYGISWDARLVKQGPVRILYNELYAAKPSKR